jgi:hypothetical protein
MTATLLLRRAATLTSVSCGLVDVAYVKLTFVNLQMGFSLLEMPSNRPGVGNLQGCERGG